MSVAARAIEQASPDSAFVLAYDAARQACTAPLAQQGLRPTTSGGHYAVEESAPSVGVSRSSMLRLSAGRSRAGFTRRSSWAPRRKCHV
jgi:hypothetical protein